MPQRGSRVREVLDVGRPGPVLEVVEVGDELGAREIFLGGEVVEVEGVREALDKLAGGSAWLIVRSREWHSGGGDRVALRGTGGFLGWRVPRAQSRTA